MTFWRIHHTKVIPDHAKENLKNHFLGYSQVRFVDAPNPMVLMWECKEEDVQDFADQLEMMGYDVVCSQRDDGVLP